MPRWTPESRLKQAAAIRRWMPWTLSTGPVTAEGKARVARNAWKGGARAEIKSWHLALRQIELIGTQLYSLIRPTRELQRTPRAVPKGPVWPSFPAWGGLESDDDDELDAIDRMSGAELQAALGITNGELGMTNWG